MAVRLYQIITLAIFIGTVARSSSAAQIPGRGYAKPLTIVLDPGHGGADHGAVYQDGNGFRVAEKDMALLLSHEIAQVLRSQGHRVVLTREQDHDLGLADRTALANRLKADLFLSIHMNSKSASAGHQPAKLASEPQGGSLTSEPSGKLASEPQGIETFVLNHSTDASSKRLADLENMVMKGSLAKSNENQEVNLIVKDLLLTANQKSSRKIACLLQNELLRSTFQPNAIVPARNRGVKQALFYVLLGADMPSALVEAGFIQSARDRASILDPNQRKRIAHGFARAIQASKNPLTLNTCKYH